VTEEMIQQEMLNDHVRKDAVKVLEAAPPVDEVVAGLPV
jgi:hypothetical protein